MVNMARAPFGSKIGFIGKARLLAWCVLTLVSMLCLSNIVWAQETQKLSILVEAQIKDAPAKLIEQDYVLEDLTLEEFLINIQSAARKLDYDGVYVYQNGSNIQSTRVIHVVDGTGEKERIEILDGRPRECLRHNGVEQCLLPERKHIISRPARSDHFPGLLLANLPAIYSHYEWRKSNDVFRIAGRNCAVSELRATDHLRYSYRFCTDLATNLLLKIQTLDSSGKLVDQLAFTRITIGADVIPEKLKSSWDTRDWSIWSESSSPVDLQAMGWRISFPDGYAPIAEMSRPLGPDHEVMQLVLSDGLAAISVFIETFRPEIVQKFKQGSLHEGAVNIYRLKLASYWLTIVGEVPRRTIEQLAGAIQFVPEAAQ